MLGHFVKNKTLSEDEDLYLGLKERADFFQTFWSKEKKLVDWDVESVTKELEQRAFKIKEYKQIGQSIKDSFEEGK